MVRAKKYILLAQQRLMFISLCVLTQLGQQTARWMKGELSYIPSIGAVCLPNRSLPVQSREIGREEFPLCVFYIRHGRNHTEACVHSGHTCARVCVCVVMIFETEHPSVNMTCMLIFLGVLWCVSVCIVCQCV